MERLISYSNFVPDPLFSAFGATDRGLFQFRLLTFLETVDLFVGEGRPVALQLPL